MDGEQVTTIVPYHIDITVPVISATSMRNSWQGDDLVLSWTNPINQPNWDKVTMLKIYLSTTSYFSASIKVLSTESSVIIPAALIQNIKNYYGEDLSRWSITTRSYTGDESNQQNARGYSSYVEIQ